MFHIDFYITTTISLFGVAYPILLQVIARLDEKYSSENIVTLFDGEIEGILFKWNLFSSLLFIVIWTFNLEPIIQINHLNYFINNSANILVTFSSISLVVIFYFYVRKILIYFDPNKFIRHLERKHKNVKNDLKYFEALGEILFLSIQQQKRNISITLSDFFYSAFRNEREKYLNEPVIYPDLYYEVVHKSIYELIIKKENRNFALEYRTGGGIWLLGELQGSIISEITYSWIWRNLLLIIQNQHDNMIVYHWETAGQYFSYSLPEIHEDIDYFSENTQITNQMEINKRISERNKFIEFHFALGGVLVYKKRYECLKRLFDHTNSEPPKYELLPESMFEIFNFYFKLNDPLERSYSLISNQYPFPEQSGMNSNSIVKKWISSYMALLFLRQYSIRSHLITMRPLDFPRIPQTQGEIKEWFNGLEPFKIMVKEHLENNILLETLGLDFITPEWCTEKNKPHPLIFINKFKTDLQDAYHNNALTLPIDKEKVFKFYRSTQSIIESTFSKLDTIINTNQIIGDFDKWLIGGRKMLQSKDAFSNNPEVHHSDYDSFLATTLSQEIMENIASTFQIKKAKTYLLKPEDYFNAIDYLVKINDQFVIVGFGFNIDKYINKIKTPGLSSNKYNNIDIYLFNGSFLVNNSLFILRKSDLPVIATLNINDNVKTKYSLEKLSERINLFASVIDMNNTSAEVFSENISENNEDDLRKSVLTTILISTEIKWKKHIYFVQLIEYSKYRQKGLPNTLSDIEVFETKPQTSSQSQSNTNDSPSHHA